jgi:hypothetical protein
MPGRLLSDVAVLRGIGLVMTQGRIHRACEVAGSATTP